MGIFDVVYSTVDHINTTCSSPSSCPSTHTALLLSPKESIVRTLYGPWLDPLVAVVHGVPTLWRPSIANSRFSDEICATGWSPCSRFFAVASEESSKIVILDAVTLE